MTAFALFSVFLQAVLLSHSGWASVAVVRSALVDQQALLTDSRLTTFLALSQITPGPLGFYLLFVGYSVQGWLGALAAWLALVLPSFLVVPIAHLLERHRQIRRLRGMTTGVVVGSAALMLSSAVTLAGTAVNTPTLIGVAAFGIVALTVYRATSLVVVLAAGVLGILLP